MRLELARAEPPSGVWLYVDSADGSLVADCGRCGAWWYIDDAEPLDDALICSECDRRQRAKRTPHLIDRRLL